MTLDQARAIASVLEGEGEDHEIIEDYSPGWGATTVALNVHASTDNPMTGGLLLVGRACGVLDTRVRGLKAASAGRGVVIW